MELSAFHDRGKREVRRQELLHSILPSVRTREKRLSLRGISTRDVCSAELERLPRGESREVDCAVPVVVMSVPRLCFKY